jgi:hypothetical protein
VDQPVTRVVDSGGNVSFAGVSYRAGRGYARRSVQVALVGGSVQLSIDGRVIRVHPARHDPAKEHGAFATPTGGHDGKALLSPSTRATCLPATGANLSPGYRTLTAGTPNRAATTCDHHRRFRLHHGHAHRVVEGPTAVALAAGSATTVLPC